MSSAELSAVPGLGGGDGARPHGGVGTREVPPGSAWQMLDGPFQSDAGGIGPIELSHPWTKVAAMVHSSSIALQAWLTSRRESIDRIAEAHVLMGEVDGPGRPLELGRPLAHSYILRMVAEFQGFSRDLYDLAAEHIVTVADPPEGMNALLTTAIIRGRSIDSGNATMTALRTDFGRLGVRNLQGKLAARCSEWDEDAGGGDAKRFNALVSLRNSLAHGNQRQVAELRRQGHLDTVSWARGQLPVLNRLCRALDWVVWDHLRVRTGASPW